MKFRRGDIVRLRTMNRSPFGVVWAISPYIVEGTHLHNTDERFYYPIEHVQKIGHCSKVQYLMIFGVEEEDA